ATTTLARSAAAWLLLTAARACSLLSALSPCPPGACSRTALSALPGAWAAHHARATLSAHAGTAHHPHALAAHAGSRRLVLFTLLHQPQIGDDDDVVGLCQADETAQQHQ